jgi:hypothetical protein
LRIVEDVYYITKDEDPTKRVTKRWFELVDGFRVGEYGDASLDTQLSWHVFCDKILPTVSKKKWKNKLVRANALLREVVTVSDEAYAMLVSKNNMAKWIQRLSSSDAKVKNKRKRNDEDENEEDAENRKTGNDDGDTQRDIDDSNDYKDTEAYYDLFEVVKERRDTIEGKSWDAAFKDSVSVAMQEGKRAADALSNQRNAGDINDHGENQRTIFVEQWVEL